MRRVRRLFAVVLRSEPVRHAFFAFAATFGLSLLGFINDVQSSMATGGHLPSVAVLAKGAMAALTGAATGLVSWVVQHATARRDATPSSS